VLSFLLELFAFCLWSSQAGVGAQDVQGPPRRAGRASFLIVNVNYFYNRMSTDGVRIIRLTCLLVSSVLIRLYVYFTLINGKDARPAIQGGS
jgi:hypothetical protein